jgi:hypothetical protein
MKQIRFVRLNHCELIEYAFLTPDVLAATMPRSTVYMFEQLRLPFSFFTALYSR